MIDRYAPGTLFVFHNNVSIRMHGTETHVSFSTDTIGFIVEIVNHGAEERECGTVSLVEGTLVDTNIFEYEVL